MDEFDSHTEYPDVPETFRAVQQSLDSFVKVNYETALGILAGTKLTREDITLYRGKIFDIIRNNPPLESIPRYYRDGREDYLWYSDFYDEATKEVFHRYNRFHIPTSEITPANYAGELAKIDLPYFKELVNLVSLEQLCMYYERRTQKEIDKEKEPEPEPEIEVATEELPDKEQLVEEVEEVEEIEVKTEPKPVAKSKRVSGKRSYKPKLNSKQYSLLGECVEVIKLFRSPVSIADIKKLLQGKLLGSLQVNNQKTLVYLLEELADKGYIKKTWISVADGNKDFMSFRSKGNELRYGDTPHYITMQQFLNNRSRSKREAIRGMDSVEDMIELMEENRDN
ncbi:hypothetical protein [Dysgonomonas sp. ZJ279]|uniref:hypothetical protein n=1 Tax=Dysgonomonas sp. ZJ279 TaxID=2709796 RepID=UPI0013ECF56F|nr:hypothetical protein [Dysgonomonas sp. ZJ279]